MLQRSVLTAILAMSGMSVLADCPTAADLRQGVYVVYDDDSYTFYQAAKGGVIVERTVFDDPDEGPYGLTLRAGLFEMNYFEITESDDRIESRTTYGMDLNEVLPVEPNQSWKTQITYRYSDDTENRETYTFSSADAGQLTIGDCTYVSIPVRHLHFEKLSETRMLSQDYLPDLGIAIYSGYVDWETEAEIYVPLSISTDKP